MSGQRLELIAAVLVLLCLAASPVARAGSIHVDFSGTFAETLCFPCDGPNLFDALVGTSFSGTIDFPASADAAVSTEFIVDPFPLEPGTGLRAIYHFGGADARFTIHTALPEFDLDGSVTPLVSVQNCTGFSCAAKDDILRIEVSTPNYFYELNTILVGGVEDVGIPSLEQLQNSELNSLADIATLDFTYGIAPDTLTPGSTTVNFSGATSVVPLPASAPLLGLAVAMLGWGARRKRRRRSASN